MASAEETRLASVSARDGVDTRNKDNSVHSCESVGGDTLPVGLHTGVAVDLVNDHCMQCGAGGDIQDDICWDCFFAAEMCRSCGVLGEPLEGGGLCPVCLDAALDLM